MRGARALAVCGAAALVIAPGIAAGSPEIVTRVGYGVASPPFNIAAKRVRDPDTDPEDFGDRFHHIAFVGGVEVPLHPRWALAFEIAGIGVPTTSRPTLLSERIGGRWRATDGVRIGGGIGFMQLFIGSTYEGSSTRNALGPLAFARADLDLVRLQNATALGTVQAEVMRVCTLDDGCSSDRGYAWTMYTVSALFGLRFD